MARIDIHHLVWPDEVIDKVASKHGLTVAEVEQAVLEDPHRQARWTNEKQQEHGMRLKVIGQSWGSHRIIVAFLDPVDADEGVWRVRTAMEVD